MDNKNNRQVNGMRKMNLSWFHWTYFVRIYQQWLWKLWKICHNLFLLENLTRNLSEYKADSI